MLKHQLVLVFLKMFAYYIMWIAQSKKLELKQYNCYGYKRRKTYAGY